MGPCAIKGAPIKKGGCKAALESTLIPPGPIQESSQSAAPAGVAQFTQRLRFNLTDAFTSYREVLSDLFESVFCSVFKPEPHLDNALLTWSQSVQDLFGHFLQVDVDDGICWRNNSAIFDEVAEMRIFFLADRGFEGDRLLRDFHDLAHFRDRDVHPLRDFF